MTQYKRTVNIIGGGIGGLTTAIALQQKGHEVHVYEQAPEIREVGAGIWVAPNAMKVYAELGVDKKIEAHGFPLGRITVCDVNRKIISDIDCAAVKRKHGFTTISIHRAVLQKLLADEIPSSNIHLHKVCTGYAENVHSITAGFSDGSSVESDVLLFADGIHSVGRKQLLPNHKLRYSGQTCWRFIADISLSDPTHMFEIWSQQKGVRVGYSPINAHQVYVFITKATPDGGKDDVNTVKKNLLALCADFDDTVKSIIKSADSSKIIRSDLFDFKPILQWTDSRMALLGDAAHATTPNLGQGACQAIEDARSIAQELTQEEWIGRALALYSHNRMVKAHFITTTSYRFAKMTNTSGIVKSLVKFIMRKTPQSVADKQMDRIYTL